MNRDQIFRTFFSVAFIILILAGCSEKDEVSHQSTCLETLDSQQYQIVANDTSCSTYERASAELGLGGVSVKRILDYSDADNFVVMFGITAEAFQENIQHLQNALTLTENLIGANRALTEVHLVAAAVALINEVWGRVDENLDGEIEETEFMDFLQIDTTAVQSSGASTFAITGEFQLVDTDGNAWIYEMDSFPAQWRADTNFDGIADGAYVSLPTSVSLSQVSFIAGITELQRLFTTDTTADIQQSFDFLQTATENAGLVDRDLGYLGISSDNQIRQIITDSIDQLDNGATCKRDVISIIDGFSAIIKNAATIDTAAEYRTHNLLTLTEAQIISSDVAFYIPSFPANLDIANAEYFVRLLYEKGTGYTGLYRNADPDIAKPLEVLRYLTIDASGDVIESDQGDGIITLNEVLCY